MNDAPIWSANPHPNHIKEGRGRGKPQWVPTERERTLVAVMAACGFPQRLICTAVEAQIAKEGGPARPISQRTLRVRFAKELSEARELCISMVKQSLFQKAVSNGASAVQAAKYFLISQHAWEEPGLSIEHDMLGKFSVTTDTVPADKPMLTWDEFYGRSAATEVIARAAARDTEDSDGA